MQLNAYNLFLKSLFKSKSVFILGQDLTHEIIAKFGVSPSNARKIIQRAVEQEIIKSSTPATFGRGQFLYFNIHVVLSKENIAIAAEKHRPHLYRLIKFMEINNGIISLYEAQKITASPFEKSSSKIDNLEDLISILTTFNIARQVIDARGAKYLIFNDNENSDESLMSNHYMKMNIDTIFIADILYWLQKHNIINNSNIRYRNKSSPNFGAIHNNFVWDAFAYTGTTGYATIKDFKSEEREKNTLVVIDIVINRDYGSLDLLGFYDRIQVVRNSTKVEARKILPIIFYKNASIEVISHIKSLGFLSFNLGVIFGEKIYDVINRLQIIKLDEISQSDDLGKIVDNIESSLSVIRTTGQETNLENIKGDLFESLMYPLIKEIYPSATIQQGKKYRTKHPDKKIEEYEYDYIVNSTNHREIVVIELKGYKSSSFIKLGDSDTRNTVRWFFRRTFPFVQNKLQDEETNVKGCYITTAQFEEETIKVLEKLNTSNIKPSQLDTYYDGYKLIELLKAKGLNNVISIIEKYYIEEES